jgi:hypothetical protein
MNNNSFYKLQKYKTKYSEIIKNILGGDITLPEDRDIINADNFDQSLSNLHKLLCVVYNNAPTGSLTYRTKIYDFFNFYYNYIDDPSTVNTIIEDYSVRKLPNYGNNNEGLSIATFKLKNCPEITSQIELKTFIKKIDLNPRSDQSKMNGIMISKFMTLLSLRNTLPHVIMLYNFKKESRYSYKIIMEYNPPPTSIMNYSDLNIYFKDSRSNLLLEKIFLFEIVYSLVCFETMGISHNDLKPDNIVFSNYEINTSKVRKYIANGNEFYLPNIGYITKLIDFEFSNSLLHDETFDNSSYIPFVNRSVSSGNYDNFGIARYFYPGFDLHSILNYIYTYRYDNINIETRDFIKEVYDRVPLNLRRDKIDNYPAKSWHLKKEIFDEVKNNLPKPSDIINHQYFSTFRSQPTNTQVGDTFNINLNMRNELRGLMETYDIAKYEF